jgi:membrane dipeptidase
MLGMEGGHAIENSLGALRAFYDLGVRYMTLTHSANIDWADSCCAIPEHNGTDGFWSRGGAGDEPHGHAGGHSHVAPKTMHDALDVTEAPVIFSHSNARAVTDHPRNVPDDVLRRMRQNGGVVMVTFVPAFLTTERDATMADVIRHIEYIRDVAGIDHVGIGGDYDGITQVVIGMEDVSTYPALFAELSRRGWSEADLRKLAGENALRAWRDAETVAQRLQRERNPSTATIERLDGQR